MRRMRITPPPPAVLPASMAAPPAAAAPSAPSKEKFVEAVKAFQRSSKECKEHCVAGRRWGEESALC